MNTLEESHPYNSMLWGTLDLEDWSKEQLQHRLLDPMHKKEVYVLVDNDDILKTEDWETSDLKPEHLVYFTLWSKCYRNTSQ